MGQTARSLEIPISPLSWRNQAISQSSTAPSTHPCRLGGLKHEAYEKESVLGKESLVELGQRGQGTTREGRFPLRDPGMPLAAHQAPVRFGVGALS